MSQQDYFPSAGANHRQDSQPRMVPDDTSTNRQASFHSVNTPANDTHTPSTNSNYSQGMTRTYPSENVNEFNGQGFSTPYGPPQTVPPQTPYDPTGHTLRQDADPYAGQYPPPRPRRSSTQPLTSAVYPPYGNDEYPTTGVLPIPQPYQPPTRQVDDQVTVHTNNSAYTRSSGHSNANSQSNPPREDSNEGLVGGDTAVAAAAGAGLITAATAQNPNEKGYYDPHAIPLGEWQQSEREADLINQSQPAGEGNMIEMADASNRRPSYQNNLLNQQPQIEPQYIEAGYPKVAPASYMRPDRDGYFPGSRGRPQPKRKPGPIAPSSLPPPTPNQYYPSGPLPPPQPYNMQPPPQPYNPPRRSQSDCCDCCCYCPAMTCCSCFCMLISLGFVAAGIAMIVYAKVASQSCPACESSNFAGICNACNTILYDGLFYGGIAVTALAGIGVVWRLFMWICSSRR
ncbi:hypothetical protein BGW37DRAFT_519733 [Umbelopsis sp. PMI_123]|nr:hypothetical protein BGW37DRAFT_519733 [Umbelopsis sp. PMI_123]